MKKNIKSLLLLLIISSVIYVIFLTPYISTNQPVVLGFDTQELWGQFIKEYYRLIDQFFLTGELPFYSWNFFLGNNFFAAKSFYVTGNIFVLIGYLFKNLHFFDLQVVLHWMMFATAACTMYFYLSQFKFKEWVKNICCIMFVFSSYAIFFTSQLQFLSFYVLFPLLFGGMEIYFKNRKPYIFILSLALLIFTNYYMVYSLSIFMVIYFTFRYYFINEGFKGFIKSAVTLVLYYIVGALISGVLFVPTIMFITGNSRVGVVKESLWIFEPLSIYFNLLIGMFVPNHTYNLLYERNMFAAWYNYEELNLWCGSLFILLIPQVLHILNKNKKKAVYLLYLVFSIILFVPAFNSMMHGFSEPSFRWTCFIIFMNIYFVALGLDNLEKLNKRKLVYTVIVTSVVLIGYIPFLCLLLKNDLSLLGSTYLDQFKIFLVSVIFIVGFSLLLLSSNKYKKALLFVIVCVEMTTFGYIYYNDALYRTYRIDRDFIRNSTHVLETNENEFNEYLLSLEDENLNQFYRVYVPLDSIYWSYSRNNGVYYNLKGLMTYDSTYTTSFDQMNELINKGDNWWKIEITDGNLVNLFNTKYAVVVDESELPSNVDWRLITDSYRGGLQIYRNDHYRPLGTSYNSAISISEYKNNPDTSLFLSEVITEDNELSEIKGLLSDSVFALENIKYGGNHILASYETPKDSFVVVGIPYDKGWNISVNGQELKKFKVNGGLMGIQVPKGEHVIEMYFTPDGFKIGLICSFTGIVMLLGLVLIRRKKDNIS